MDKDDPRQMPELFYHQYSGSLGKLDKILKQYGANIRYTLSHDGEDCKVEVRYAKRESDMHMIIDGGPGNFVVKNAKSFDTSSFLKVLNEGIEKTLDDSYHSLMNL